MTTIPISIFLGLISTVVVMLIYFNNLDKNRVYNIDYIQTFFIVFISSMLFFFFSEILIRKMYAKVTYPTYNATIVDIVSFKEAKKSKSRMYTPVYQFKVDNKTIKLKGPISTSEKPFIGQKVQIHYKNGKIEENTKINYILDFGILVLIIFTFGILIFNILRALSLRKYINIFAAFSIKFIIKIFGFIVMIGIEWLIIINAIESNDSKRSIALIIASLMVMLAINAIIKLDLRGLEKEFSKDEE